MTEGALEQLRQPSEGDAELEGVVHREARRAARAVAVARARPAIRQKYGLGTIFTSIGAPYHFSQVSLT